MAESFFAEMFVKNLINLLPDRHPVEKISIQMYSFGKIKQSFNWKLSIRSTKED